MSEGIIAAKEHTWRIYPGVGQTVVSIGLVAILFDVLAEAAQVKYLDSSGRVETFDASSPPEWARDGAIPTKRLKLNEITFNLTYKDVTANNGAGNGIGFDHPTLGVERRAVVDRVLEYLGDVLNEGPPAACDIVFGVSETDGAGFLATAGPFFFDSPNGFRNGFAFDHLTTGIDPIAGAGDIACQVDFGFPWYTDVGTPPPPNTFDLFTALLHELTHGIGMVSMVGASGESLVSGGNPGVYTHWDELIARGNGTALFDAATNFTGTPGSLAGNEGGIVFLGALARSLFGGVAPRLYAPSPFVLGSSLSHFDESIPGPLLMHYLVGPGVAIREYRQLEIAALRDIGYTKASGLGSPSAAFLSSQFSIGETTGDAVIVVQLSEPPGVGHSASLQYEASPGTASAGADFRPVAGTLDFGPFDSVKSFAVPIMCDEFREPGETVNLRLTAPDGLTLSAPNTTATVTIVDDDPNPAAFFDNNAIVVNEADGKAVVSVMLTAPPGIPETASVRCATGGGTASINDYQSVDEVIVFGPGETRKDIEIGIIDDSNHEPEETILVQLTLPAGLLLTGPTYTPALVTIVDNDPDSDGDGISDEDERTGAWGFVTDPGNRDSDGDFIGDGEEILGTLGPRTDPTWWDTDGDGVSDGMEIYGGTDPTDPTQQSSLRTLSVPFFQR